MAIAGGTQLGPYEIQEMIGAGGMGEVYKARDRRLNRTVAIKILASSFSENPELKQRLEREAQTIAALNHPHVCTLHDVGQYDGSLYLVMEFIEGETLSGRLDKGPLPLDEAIRFAIQIAAALDKAHAQGVIHRDLKPGNIMLTKSGAKLLDFGLARLVPGMAPLDNLPTKTSADPLTARGTILGTVQYMAPEQIEGEDAGARTDIFAFGAVLYEMVTGKKAFKGKSQSSLMASILEHDPAPISTFQSLTPPALQRLVETCLAKDPADRWQTAHDVMLHLQWIAEGGSAAGVAAPLVKQRKNRERIAWSLMAVALLGLITVSVLHYSTPPEETGLCVSPYYQAEK